MLPPKLGDLFQESLCAGAGHAAGVGGILPASHLPWTPALEMTMSSHSACLGCFNGRAVPS